MGQFTTDFPALPDTNDSTWPAVYEMVYGQLTAMGLPTPGTPHYLISRANLLKHLQKQAGQLLKVELQSISDPDYTGQTDAQSAVTANEYHTPGDWHHRSVPINRILQALPFAPNSITEDDVKESKKNGA